MDILWEGWGGRVLAGGLGWVGARVLPWSPYLDLSRANSFQWKYKDFLDGFNLNNGLIKIKGDNSIATWGMTCESLRTQYAVPLLTRCLFPLRIVA